MLLDELSEEVGELGSGAVSTAEGGMNRQYPSSSDMRLSDTSVRGLYGPSDWTSAM